MNAMAAERLREPEQIYTPHFPPEMVDEIVAALTEEGGRMFFRQVTDAMARVQSEGDLRPLNDVYESFYRTLIFVSGDDTQANWDIAQEDTSPGLTADQIRARRLAGRSSR